MTSPVPIIRPIASGRRAEATAKYWRARKRATSLSEAWAEETVAIDSRVREGGEGGDLDASLDALQEFADGSAQHADDLRALDMPDEHQAQRDEVADAWDDCAEAGDNAVAAQRAEGITPENITLTQEASEVCEAALPDSEDLARAMGIEIAGE